MTDHDFIRKHILDWAGIPDKPARSVDLDGTRRNVVSAMVGFWELMFHRILMGRFRYGEFGTGYRDMAEDLERCLRNYKKSRNTEFLVDLANYAWIEFRHGTHPDKHFRTIDDGEHSKQ